MKKIPENIEYLGHEFKPANEMPRPGRDDYFYRCINCKLNVRFCIFDRGDKLYYTWKVQDIALSCDEIVIKRLLE